MLSFTVIIPVFENQRGLEECLDSLINTDNTKYIREIIVVDNAELQTIQLKNLKNHDNRIKILHEPIAGSYAARNTGIRNSTSIHIALIDSDCIPKSDWLENASKVFLHEGAERICGDIEFTFEEKNSKYL